MSIFFDFNVGISGRRFRRAVDGDRNDVEEIAKLNSEYNDQIFGKPDVASLIELSTLSICMINESKEVIGFMSLCDHPNVHSVNPADWEVWIRNMFHKFYLSRNTLFVHYMCCVDAIADVFLEEAFVSVFRNDMYLLNIVIVVPSSCPKDWTKRYQTFKKHNIYKTKPITEDYCENYIYTALQKEFCPKLKVRRAVEEDNDDIVYILAKTSPRLHDLYGDYYISEIIGRHPEMDRKIIVAEYQDQAAGVMCLNSDVKYKMLQNTYELACYHGLRKETPLEKEENNRANDLIRIFGDPIMLGKWSPFSDYYSKDIGDTESDTSKENLPPSNVKETTKVNFERQAAFRKSFDSLYYKNRYSEDLSEREFNSPTPSTATVRSLHFLLEDDPFDYEIINIDKQLLTVPEALSYEFLTPLPRPQERRVSKASAIKGRMNRRFSSFKSSMRDITEMPEYSGDPNAFMIELFGLREDIDDNQAFHLLEAAFEIMKDFDYCIIRVPCNEKRFSLLQHFCFVPTRNNISCEYALYVAHRNSVLSKLRVRRAELMDIPQIATLLRTLNGKETVWTVENTILNKNTLQCYVFFSSTALIGVGILEQPEQIDFIRAKFNLDTYRINKYQTNQGIHCGLTNIKAVIVYPVFEPHYRFFMRDVLRLSGNNSLMWLTAYRNKWVTHKANSMVGSMIPLIPRKSVVDCTHIPQLSQIRKLDKNVMAFSAWFISKKLSSVLKINVDTRIVIVGASRTAMSFLNELLFSDSCTYLTFTSVTLVSPNGLPYTKRPKTAAELMFEKYRTNTDKYLKSVPYTYYVNVVQGTMSEINKREKYIRLLKGGKCYYDMLFLLLGKQYQHPKYLKDILNKEDAKRCGTIPQYSRLDIPHDSDEPIINNYTPVNVFIVNTKTEANKALTFIKSFDWSNADYKIVVYGATIHAYCCLATLVNINVPTSNIIFVEPFPEENSRKARVSLFSNTYVDKSVRELLKNLKIKVYESYYFQRWFTGSDNYVTHIEFLSHFHLIKLQCSAFFYYGARGVNEQAYIAFHKSGMAYDGGVLIDHEFRTKDPSVYAAGPITRYYRRYYAEHRRQKYYNAHEVGKKLGSQIRNQLDPLFKEKEKEPAKPTIYRRKNVSFDLSTVESKHTINDTIETSTRSSESFDSEVIEFMSKLPKFKMPNVLYCILPGGLRYLEVRPPGKKNPHHYVQSLNHIGHVMETFKCGYFKLHLNNDLIVDGITCLTPEEYSLENFQYLYGLSALVLNNVHLRYSAKKLDNFYDFFRAPWAYFMYHDQADELFAMVKELHPKGERHGNTLEEAFQTVGESLSNPSFKFNTKLKIRAKFEKSPHVGAITDYILEWLSENDVVLPMYLQPWQVARYESDLDQNPVFRRKKCSITKMMTKIF